MTAQIRDTAQGHSKDRDQKWTQNRSRLRIRNIARIQINEQNQGTIGIQTMEQIRNRPRFRDTAKIPLQELCM